MLGEDQAILSLQSP